MPRPLQTECAPGPNRDAKNRKRNTSYLLRFLARSSCALTSSILDYQAPPELALDYTCAPSD